MQIESQFQFSLLFASFYNFHYCKEVYSGVESLFCMHNVCPHSTMSALVFPGQTICYEGRETTASNRLLFQRAYMYVSIWWLCQNVKWHNFLVLQETLRSFRSNEVMAARSSKNNRFDKQNNNFPCASHLSVHFFAIFAWLHCKNPYCRILWRT